MVTFNRKSKYFSDLQPIMNSGRTSITVGLGFNATGEALGFKRQHIWAHRKAKSISCLDINVLLNTNDLICLRKSFFKHYMLKDDHPGDEKLEAPLIFISSPSMKVILAKNACS